MSSKITVKVGLLKFSWNPSRSTPGREEEACARTLCRSSERIFFLFFSPYLTLECSGAGLQEEGALCRGKDAPKYTQRQAIEFLLPGPRMPPPRFRSLIDATRFRRKKGRPCRKDWYQYPETSLAFASAARAHSRSIFAAARKRNTEHRVHS